MSSTNVPRPSCSTTYIVSLYCCTQRACRYCTYVESNPRQTDQHERRATLNFDIPKQRSTIECSAYVLQSYASIHTYAHIPTHFLTRHFPSKASTYPNPTQLSPLVQQARLHVSLHPPMSPVGALRRLPREADGNAGHRRQTRLLADGLGFEN